MKPKHMKNLALFDLPNKSRAVRRALDAYGTPSNVIEPMRQYLRPYQPRRILEPACGDGAIVRILKREFPLAEIVVGDVSSGQDFLRHDYGGELFDLVMTNPPFALALEFVQRALRLRSKGGAVVTLLRLNFLASNKRADFMRANIPSLYVISDRPSFTGVGKDHEDYGWYIWDDGPPRRPIVFSKLRSATPDDPALQEEAIAPFACRPGNSAHWRKGRATVYGARTRWPIHDQEYAHQ
jgi:hypothetical protein